MHNVLQMELHRLTPSFSLKQSFKLNSSENAKLAIMARNIRIPSAPVLQNVSDNFTLEMGLRRMFEGLHLHRSLLSSVLPHLNHKDKVTELLADIKDLLIQIPKVREHFYISLYRQACPLGFIYTPCGFKSFMIFTAGFVFLCPPDVENGPNGACGAADSGLCGLKSPGGI